MVISKEFASKVLDLDDNSFQDFVEDFESFKSSVDMKKETIEQIFKNKIGLGWNNGLTAKEQRELFGFAVLGRKKRFYVRDTGIDIRFITGFGSDYHDVFVTYRMLESALREKKDVILYKFGYRPIF